MTEKTYHGSCVCGTVAFEAEIDLAAGTTRCNCTTCRKRRNWAVTIPRDRFRFTRGETAVYRKAVIDSHFCPVCGTTLVAFADIEEMGGKTATLQIGTLDDATTEELIAAPVTWVDGLNDDWWHAPEEVRHL
jgi:hypothetical protein